VTVSGAPAIPVIGGVTQTYTRGGTATVEYVEPDMSAAAPVDIADTSTVIDTASLAGKPLTVLREIARSRGLRTTRGRDEQVAVILESLKA
jgi:hypothetical protein